MNCTGKRCLAQYNKVDPATCPAVSYCPQATPPKTNADRIRSMADEELAKFLCCMNHECYECPGDEMCSNGENGMLRWLKEEAKDG